MRRIRSSVLQSAYRLGLAVRGRGVSDGAAVALSFRGTGAPSLGRYVAAALVVGVLAAALVPQAHAGKVVDRIVAGSTSSGTTGGLFNQPRGIAVNASGAGNAAVGDIFVVDGLNNRIQQLAADGSFIRAWGADVSIPAGGTAMETCTVASDCKAGTAPNPAVGGAFNAAQGIAIDQTDGSIYITDQGNRRVQKFTLPANPTDPVVFDRAWGWDVTTGSVTTFEVCAVAPSCKQGTLGANGGQFNTNIGFPTVVPAGNPNAGNVIVGDRGPNRRISEFEADGDYVRSFGWDVVPTSQPGDLGTNNFEICTSTATGACQSGAFPTTFPIPAGQFDINQPFHVAVDANGVLYASDTVTAAGRVQRFDTTQATPAGLLMTAIPVPTITGTSSSSLTTGLALDAAGHLQVARDSLVDAVLELADPAGSPSHADTHYAGAGLMSGNANSTPNGLAVAPGSGDLYMTSQTGGHRVFVADDDGAPPASAVATDPTGVTTTTATLNGTINPNGPFAVDYRFQYSADGVDWTDAGTDTQLPGGNTPVPISANVTRLKPNTFYRVRLVIQKPFGNPQQITAEAIFLTDALPTASPTIDDLVPAWVEQTRATLQAEINPNGLATRYHFEYGADPVNLDRRIPADAELVLAQGSDPVTVEAAPTGLDPETPYFFRVVAANSKGTTVSAGQPFETLNAQGLTQGRRLELVTPADKGLSGETAQQIDGSTEHAPIVSPDGESAGYAVAYALPGSATASEPFYRASRGADGWTSTEISPPTAGEIVNFGGAAHNQRYYFLSKDLSCGFLTTGHLLTDDAAAGPVREAGRWNFYRQNTGGFTLVPDLAPVDPSGGGVSVPWNTYLPVAASEDCSRVLFKTVYSYPGVPFAGEGLYEWDEGVLRSPGVIPGPSGPEFASQVKFGAGEGSVNPAIRNVLSEDGSRLFFSAASRLGGDIGQEAIFMREDGAVGVDVSQSQTATPNSGASHFQKATPSGSDVFFLARYGLADNASSSGLASCDASDDGGVGFGAGCDLYRYSVDTGTLTDVSASSSPEDSQGASVAGVLDASDDGSRVYFAARGQLVPGEGNTQAENLSGSLAFNVYLWDSGTLSYVATIPHSDIGPTGALNVGVLVSHPDLTVQNEWASRVTPTGSHLMFQSRADLTGYDSGGAPEAFLFSAQSGELVCVSCRRDGEPSVFSGVPDIQTPAKPLPFYGQFNVASRRRAQISDDGSRVFFTSYDPLAPGAVSGDKNFYEWHDGQVTLLGTDGADEVSVIVGSSTDGDSVFFTTDGAGVAWDTDGRKDLYVARVGGGGFSTPPSRPEGCSLLADACQGGGSSAGDRPVATGGAGAGDDAVLPARGELSFRRLTAGQLAGLVAGRRVRLAVRVNRPGRVAVVGRARIAGKVRRVLSSSRAVRRAGEVKLAVRLSPAARRALSARGGLKVTLSVSSSNARGSRLTLKLKPAKAGKRTITSRKGGAR
jgi:hypothetical protein